MWGGVLILESIENEDTFPTSIREVSSIGSTIPTV